jgi:hypothetical protein
VRLLRKARCAWFSSRAAARGIGWIDGAARVFSEMARAQRRSGAIKPLGARERATGYRLQPARMCMPHDLDASCAREARSQPRTPLRTPIVMAAVNVSASHHCFAILAPRVAP